MGKRVLKILGLIAAVLLLLGVGAAVGGSIVYAMRQARGSGGLTIYSDEVGDESGVVIASVVPDGPAAEAGVERGDILLKLNDESVDSVAQLARALDGREPGDEVELTVLHGDDERTLPVTLGEQDGAPYLGIVPCVGIPGDARGVRIGAPGPGAMAMIVEVEPDSPADEAGLEAGDIVVAVDGQELDSENTLADLIAAHEPGDTVTLQIEEPGDEEPSEVTVELGEHPDEEGVAYLGVRYHSTPPRRVIIEGAPFEWQRFDGPMHIVPGGAAVQGAVIRYVDEDSPAETAGLRAGDLITAVDGEVMKSPQELADIIAEHKPGGQVTLTILGNGGEDEARDVEVTLGEHPDEEGKAYLGVSTGGFIHLQRVEEGEWPHEDGPELFFDWDESFDELPFGPDEMPQHFEFRFRPNLSDDETDCCGSSI
jgi:S1-C subfamily serine protease